MVDLVRRVRASVFLVERDAVGNGQAPPAMFDGPAEAGQPRRSEVLVPCPSFFKGLVLAPRCSQAPERGEFADAVVGEPVADLGPELLDLHHPCRLTYQALA